MKKSITYLSLILVGFLMFSCAKEAPAPCPEAPEVCEATPFTEGFKTNFVGVWKFDRMAWFNQFGTFLEYKDSADLGASYSFEIREGGVIDYYRNDTLLDSKKLLVGYEAEGNPPVEPIGVLTGYLDCQTTGDYPSQHQFGFSMYHLDTILVSYLPVTIVNEATGEYSGRSFYYRIP